MNLSLKRQLSVFVFGISASVLAQAASVAPVAAEHGMVVTAQHLATQVGVDVLKKGGNAVDAAVAVGYALAVVYPAAGNLGGGGGATAPGTGGISSAAAWACGLSEKLTISAPPADRR